MATKIMREPWLWKRFTSNAIEQYLGVPGEPIIDLRSGTPALHVCDGVTPGGVAISMDIAFEGIARPTIVSPLNGATNVSNSPIITASAFVGLLSDGTDDTHAASTWNFYSDANKTNLIFTSGRSTTALTSFDTDGLYAFADDTQVYVEVVYEGSTGNEITSALTSFTTISMGVGAVLPDGGIVFAQEGGDWLVVAPASQRTTKAWGLYGTDTNLPNVSGTTGSPTTPNDPNSSEYNTDILTSPPYNTVNDGQGSVGTPAADYCRSLGYDLPNAKDLQLIYNNRSQIDAVDASSGATLSAIQNGTAPGSTTASVWSSTESNSYRAWYLYFGDGNWGASTKYTSLWVVPVKRIPV